VSGTARFTVGQTTYEAPAGTLVMVPPGAPHTFANPTDATTVLLSTFTPDLYVEYFRDLRGMIADGQPLTDFFSLTTDQVFQRSFHNPEPFRLPAAIAVSGCCGLGFAVAFAPRRPRTVRWL
jgi:Cupin domain